MGAIQKNAISRGVVPLLMRGHLVIMQLPSKQGPAVPIDYSEMHSKAGLTCFAHIPLIHGKVVHGTMLISSSAAISAAELR